MADKVTERVELKNWRVEIGDELYSRYIETEQLFVSR